MCIHQRDLPKKKPCTMKTENDNRAMKEFYDEFFRYHLILCLI